MRLAVGCAPVRGDLAHIALAGKVFVPHYAVPMPHFVARDGAEMRAVADRKADAVSTLSEGATFDVLDIAGDWAWGQHGEDGPVGYVALENLVRNGA